MSRPDYFRHPSRTADHKMKIRNIKTRLVLERASPDAVDAVESGGYEFVDSTEPSIREILLGLPWDLLEATAAQCQIRTFEVQRDYVVEKLIPKIESGEVVIGS